MNAIYIACSLITLAYFIYLIVFYLGIGIIKCLMEKRYYMVLQNIFIIIVVFFGLYCIGYFRWVQSATRIVFSIFS